MKKSSKHLPLPSEHDHPESKGASASYFDSSDDSLDYLPTLGPLSTIKEGSPGDLDSDSRKDGEDWFALYNPREPRSLNVDLVFQVNHESIACCVRFSKDGLWLATGCNRIARIFDMRTHTLNCTLIDENISQEKDMYIRSICFSPDGKYLATGAEDWLIRVNSLHYASLTGDLVCWDTDIPSILSSQIWDIARKCIRYTFKGHQDIVYTLDISHDGSFIVSGSGDNTMRIWDMTTRESKVFPIDGPDTERGVASVAISPDARFVAAGSVDKVVRIWDVATGTLVHYLRGHSDSVYSVAFMPDGKGLVSCSIDKTLKYWEFSAALSGPIETGGQLSECMRDFTGHRDYVLSVAISHDGQWIVSGSKDCGVQFWDRHGRTHLMLQGHFNSGTQFSLRVF